MIYALLLLAHLNQSSDWSSLNSVHLMESAAISLNDAQLCEDELITEQQSGPVCRVWARATQDVLDGFNSLTDWARQENPSLNTVGEIGDWLDSQEQYRSEARAYEFALRAIVRSAPIARRIQYLD